MAPEFTVRLDRSKVAAEPPAKSSTEFPVTVIELKEDVPAAISKVPSSVMLVLDRLSVVPKSNVPLMENDEGLPVIALLKVAVLPLATESEPLAKTIVPPEENVGLPVLTVRPLTPIEPTMVTV